MKTFAIAALLGLASAVKLQDTTAGGPPAGGPPADGPMAAGGPATAGGPPAGGPPADGPMAGGPPGDDFPLPSEIMDMICEGDAECAFDSIFFMVDDNINGNIEPAEFDEVANALAAVGTIDQEDADAAIAGFVEEAGEDGATRDEVLGWIID